MRLSQVSELVRTPGTSSTRKVAESRSHWDACAILQATP